MAELLDELGQLARERADSVQRASRALAGEAEGFLFVAKDSCNFVVFLSLVWKTVELRLRRGGVPAGRLLQECDLLIELSAGAGRQLAQITKVWQERNLPADAARPVYGEVRQAGVLLDSLVQSVRETRARAATPPRISPDPEDVKQRIRRADEEGTWLKLADVAANLRQGTSPKQGEP